MKIFLVGLTLGLATAGRADVIYSLRYMEPGNIVSRVPETRVMVSKNAKLEERFSWHSWTYQHLLTLTDTANKRVIEMDSLLKIYRIQPFGIEQAVPTEEKAQITVTQLDEAKVLGFSTRHFRIDTVIKDLVRHKGTDVKTDLVSRQEIWVAPAESVKGFYSHVNPQPYANVINDLDVWKRIQSGLMVRQTISQPSEKTPGEWQEVYTEEISSFAPCKELDSALFALPGDYRELPAAEFVRAQNRWVGAGIDREPLDPLKMPEVIPVDPRT